ESAIGVLLPRLLSPVLCDALPGLRNEMERTAGHQKLCGSAACRRGYRDIVAHQTEGKFGAKPQSTSDVVGPSANPIKKGVCGAEEIDRPRRLVAGFLTDPEFHLASLPIDKATAARVHRLN